MMTDGTRRTKAGRIRLVPVEDREAHEERVEAMRNHPSTYIDDMSRPHLIPLDGGASEE